MTRENIRIQNPNFTTDGEYYYTLSYSGQVLQAKTDSGVTAFSYPCDTPLTSAVNSLEWDGVYFWSLESKAGGDGFIIRKWCIDAYILKQIIAYTYTNTGTHTYSSNDFAVEHYRITVKNNDNGGGGYTYGMSDINISDTSMLSPGDVLTFVRKWTPTQERYSTSYVETRVVQQVIDSDTVRLTSAMTGDPYGDGKGFRGPGASYGVSDPVPPDLVFVTKYVWVLNNYEPGGGTSGALYKINAANGSNVVQYTGSQYDNIKGATFYTKYSVSGTYPNQYNTTIYNNERYVLFVNGSVLIFYDVVNNTEAKSLSIENVKQDLVSIWDVYDLAVAGFEPNITLYRLQLGTTYGSPASDESWSSTYSYEKTILRRIVHSIAIVAEPSVVPADGASTSSITAIVRDQYNNTVPAGKTVSWADDSGESRLSPTSSTTDAFGRASTVYTAGSTEQDVKITATVTNGLI